MLWLNAESRCLKKPLNPSLGHRSLGIFSSSHFEYPENGSGMRSETSSLVHLSTTLQFRLSFHPFSPIISIIFYLFLASLLTTCFGASVVKEVPGLDTPCFKALVAGECTLTNLLIGMCKLCKDSRLRQNGCLGVYLLDVRLRYFKRSALLWKAVMM